MRLINTNSFMLTEVFERDAKPYTILSHTWSAPGTEVSFEEMRSGEVDVDTKGYYKIKEHCRITASYGFEFAWVDTCCIDKSSSAELSEAINSMYTWYKNAAICFVYLADVAQNAPDGTIDPAFCHSRWFTRGWTLQELIAPQEVWFFSENWELIGTKSDLKSLITGCTRIHELALSTPDIEGFSIAQRMSWASDRRTTRPEDMAYCLMGLFNVNMPLLYGEGGEKAFSRLQEELLKISDDQSLFAWGSEDPIDSADLGSYLLDKRGLLAKSPANFGRFGNVIPTHRSPESGPSSITNKGVRLSVPLIRGPIDQNTYNDGLWALIDCHFEDDLRGQIGIPLYHWAAESDQYSRKLSDPALIPLICLPSAVEEVIYVRAGRNKTFKLLPAPPDKFFVLPGHAVPEGFELVDVFPHDPWNHTEGLFRLEDKNHSESNGRCCVAFFLAFRRAPTLRFIVLLEYQNSRHETLITSIMIQKDEGRTLKALHQQHQFSKSKQIKNMYTKFAELEFGDERLDVNIEIRRQYLLGKVLYLIVVRAEIEILETGETMMQLRPK